LTDAHAAIEWTRSARELHDLIRGCDPSPGAHTSWRGATLRLFDPQRTREQAGSAAPGTVLEVGETISIAARDGVIRCKRMRADGAKAPAAEVAATAGIAPGALLGAG
jgi:methionyl-tRNA formyltransferase